MPNVRVAVQQAAKEGITPTNNGSLSTSDTYQVNNDGKTFLHVKKSGATDCTVTIATPNTIDGLAVADQTVTVVASTGDKMIGPFRPDLFNDANHDINVTFSNITGLTVAAVRL